ncbi:unnamed protein product [Amoebophrya sp. A25]|nr:unnamed protein product [Amoebophrya sp. A25]|eukprot:GSA25T00020052001.1
MTRDLSYFFLAVIGIFVFTALALYVISSETPLGEDEDLGSSQRYYFMTLWYRQMRSLVSGNDLYAFFADDVNQYPAFETMWRIVIMVLNWASMLILVFVQAHVTASYDRVRDAQAATFDRMLAGMILDLEASFSDSMLSDERLFPRYLHVLLPVGENVGLKERQAAKAGAPAVTGEGGSSPSSRTSVRGSPSQRSDSKDTTTKGSASATAALLSNEDLHVENTSKLQASKGYSSISTTPIEPPITLTQFEDLTKKMMRSLAKLQKEVQELKKSREENGEEDESAAAEKMQKLLRAQRASEWALRKARAAAATVQQPTADGGAAGTSSSARTVFQSAPRRSGEPTQSVPKKSSEVPPINPRKGR